MVSWNSGHLTNLFPSLKDESSFKVFVFESVTKIDCGITEIPTEIPTKGNLQHRFVLRKGTELKDRFLR